MSLGFLKWSARDSGCQCWGKAPDHVAIPGEASSAGLGYGTRGSGPLSSPRGCPRVPLWPEWKLCVQSCLRHRAHLGLSQHLSLSVTSCESLVLLSPVQSLLPSQSPAP